MKNFRILIVDDNPDIHKDFNKILKICNDSHSLQKLKATLFGIEKPKKISSPQYQIDSAYQGIEAVKRVQTALSNETPYALAFVDVLMPPGLDGVETAKRIWEIDPDIQIVLCSAYADYSWDEILNKLGMTDNLLILKKPFDAIEILQMACCLTQKWFLSQQIGHQFDRLHQELINKNEGLEDIQKL